MIARQVSLLPAISNMLCLPYRTQLLLLSPPLLVIHYAPAGAASVVSNSVRPHRWQPTKLPHPWDSPGKNTGVDLTL